MHIESIPLFVNKKASFTNPSQGTGAWPRRRGNACCVIKSCGTEYVVFGPHASAVKPAWLGDFKPALSVVCFFHDNRPQRRDMIDQMRSNQRAFIRFRVKAARRFSGQIKSRLDGDTG